MPGGNHNRASAATGGFPWAARTVASVDSDARSKARDKAYYARHVLRQIEAEEAAKAQCRACLKPLVANCPYWACPQKWPEITDNIPHNLTYRDKAIPASHLPCAGRGRVNERIDAPALFTSERN